MEYHVMSTKTVQGVNTELEKRTQEGWRLVEAYGLGSNEHVLIFDRSPVDRSAPKEGFSALADRK
jgi:hypothetical protein